MVDTQRHRFDRRPETLANRLEPAGPLGVVVTDDDGAPDVHGSRVYAPAPPPRQAPSPNPPRPAPARWHRTRPGRRAPARSTPPPRRSPPYGTSNESVTARDANVGDSTVKSLRKFPP